MSNDISRESKGILSIPHSPANVERIFSYQNLIETKWINKLFASTIELKKVKFFVKVTTIC